MVAIPNDEFSDPEESFDTLSAEIIRQKIKQLSNDLQLIFHRQKNRLTRLSEPDFIRNFSKVYAAISQHRFILDERELIHSLLEKAFQGEEYDEFCKAHFKLLFREPSHVQNREERRNFQFLEPKKIRSFLKFGFDFEELYEFCYDTPKFREVLDKVSQRPSTKELIQGIIDHAYRQELISELLDYFEPKNTNKYEEYIGKTSFQRPPSKFELVEHCAVTGRTKELLLLIQDKGPKEYDTFEREREKLVSTYASYWEEFEIGSDDLEGGKILIPFHNREAAYEPLNKKDDFGSRIEEASIKTGILLRDFALINAKYRGKVDFAVRIEGASMVDSIPDGDLALIRKQKTVDNDEIVYIVVRPGDQKPFGVFKLYEYRNDGKGSEHHYLKSTKSSAKDIIVIPCGSDAKKIRERYVDEIKANKIEPYDDSDLDIVGKYIGSVKEQIISIPIISKIESTK